MHKHNTFKELQECAEHNNFLNSSNSLSNKEHITEAIQELIDDPQYKDFNPDKDRDKTIRLIANKMFHKTFKNTKNIDTLTNILIDEATIKNNLDKIKKEVINGGGGGEDED